MIRIISLFKNLNFSRFWVAQVISQFGDRINQMALVGLIMSRAPGSAFGLAKVLSFTIIPVFIIGPIAGAYVDRWDRRTTMFVCDFARAALVALIPLIFMRWESLVPIYIIVFLVFTFSRFHVPAKMAFVPDLVEEKHLVLANSLVTVTGMIAFVFGILFGSLVVDFWGAKAGFIGDAVTYLASGLLVLTISKDLKLNFDRRRMLSVSKEMIRDIRTSIITEIRDGVSYLFNHKDIRFILNMLFTLFSAAGAIYVVIIVFVHEAFGQQLRVLGFLASVLGVGLFVGSLLFGRYGQKLNRYKLIFACLIAGGAMLVLFASLVRVVSSIPLATVLTFVLGLVVGPIFIAANTVIHEVCADEMRGKVFSGLEVVIHFAFLVAMLLSSAVAEFVPEAFILMAAGVVIAVVGLVGMGRYKEM